MTDITALLTLLETHWTDVAALGVLVVGFVIGRKLLRRVTG